MSNAKPSPPVPLPGLRERNKIDKLRRIKEAASKLFLQRGFDDATTREIARVADVGLGTLFSYAADKRDLLFLIVNDELEEMVAGIEATLKAGTIEQQLHDFSNRHFIFFARQPALSRLLLREQQFYADTAQANRFTATRMRARLLIERIVRLNKKSGVLEQGVDVVLAARLIFVVYQMQLREWLAEEPLDLKQGLASLDKSFRMLLKGMKPRS